MSFQHKFNTALKGKCPYCGEGNMWNYGAYKLTKMSAMNKKCSKCNGKFEPEPSFYTGAMYVGYAFTVAIVISVFTVFNVLSEDPNVTLMFLCVVFIAILFAPLNLRLSRNIWAAMLLGKNK